MNEVLYLVTVVDLRNTLQGCRKPPATLDTLSPEILHNRAWYP